MLPTGFDFHIQRTVLYAATMEPIEHEQNSRDDDTMRDNNLAMVQVPRLEGVNDNLHRVTEQTRTRGRPANTSKAYDGKKRELLEYLDYVWETDPYRRILDHYKVYRFISTNVPERNV